MTKSYEKRPHPVPITLGKYKNPKVTDADWRRWREEQLQEEQRLNPARGPNGRRLPIRYDEESDE